MKTIELDAVVNRLILQFQEYTMWNQIIAQLEIKKLQCANEIAQMTGRSLTAVMAATFVYPNLQGIEDDLELAKLDQQRISNEMSYQNHLVWMLYKHRAYIGTPQEILTVGAFQRHCTPKDYICTKRYTFLKNWLAKNGIDIEDKLLFPKDMMLAEYCEHPIFTQLLDDALFLRRWKFYEYHIADGQIAKWQNFSS